MADPPRRCEWFDQDAVLLNNQITKPISFQNTNIDDKYKKVLTDYKTFNGNNHKFELFNNEDLQDNNRCIISHKYQINLSKVKPNPINGEVTFSQADKMVGFMNECVFIYNLCVSIWEDYEDVTDNWIVLKNVIYDLLYRDANGKNDLDITKKAIIQQLKDDRAKYIELNKVYEAENAKMRLERDEEYREAMRQYSIAQKENKRAVIKQNLVKPVKRNIVPLKVPIIKDDDERRNRVPKPAPDDSLKWEIKEFCTNLKTCRKRKFEEQIDFVLKCKETDKTMCMLLSSRCFRNNGIYPTQLGKLDCKNYKKILEKYQNNINDSKICYDVILKRFHLLVVHEVDKVDVANRKEVVAIDEGEKTFLAFYSNNAMGKMGDNMRKVILPLKRKIVRMEKTLATNKNKDGLTLKNKNKVRRNIRKTQLKIQNYANNVHRKASLYLCSNYENIFLPEFKTKDMVRNKVNGNLPKTTKTVMMAQSHYKFKVYLKNKALRYRTKVIDVDEKFTSQMCAECGMLSKVYDANRLKTCPCCNYQIDRDVNGSKNILLKCVTELHKNPQ